VKKDLFKGNTETTNGHVLQCQQEAKNHQKQFLKTVEALGEYINKTLDYPQDIHDRVMQALLHPNH